MIATPAHTPMSAADYLAWEPLQEMRYEFHYGEVLAMTGGTVPHNDVAINLLMQLLPSVRSQGCRINMADVKLLVDPAGLYYYPDLMVSCDPRDQHAHQFIQFPKLIAEVLSPGTASKDRGDKFIDYQQLPSLQEYLLINSDKISIECYRRGEGRMWLYYPYGQGDTIHLGSLGVEFAVSNLYIGIQFPEPHP